MNYTDPLLFAAPTELQLLHFTVPITSSSLSKFPYTEFARHLTRWFASAQRDLPWRSAENARDPYRILVSEVMLQQTTVAAVVPFYQRFLARFPDISTLAHAEIEEVLPFWAGLGYYSRARNLHSAARTVVEQHNGQFPTDFEKVLALPGVGPYTAGAVCSIAFDQKTPIVDANIMRVLARVLCLEGDIKSTFNQKRLWQEARLLVEASAHPAQFNPALMELGALLCTPRKPECGMCPVAKFCCAFQSQRQAELPQLARPKKKKQMRDLCIFIGDGREVLLRQRTSENTDKNWWQGMWELPRTTVGDSESTLQALQRLLTELQIEGQIGCKIKTLKHTVTVHDITLECYVIDAKRSQFTGAELFEWDELRELAVPSTMKKLLTWLQHHHLQNRQLNLLE